MKNTTKSEATTKTTDLTPGARAYERYREVVAEVLKVMGVPGTALDERWIKNYPLGGYYDTISVAVRFEARFGGEREYGFKVEVNWGALGAKVPGDALVFAKTLEEAATLAARLDWLTREFTVREAERKDFFEAQAAHFAAR